MMGISMHRPVAALLLIILVVSYSTVVAAEELRYPVHVTRYDLATRDELLYGYWLRPLIQTDDAATWNWPKEFVATVGKWSAAYIDGPKVLDAALNGCPIVGGGVKVWRSAGEMAE